MKTISFTAERVGTFVEKFTDTYIVYTVSFGVGELDGDGDQWSFSRSYVDDDGVCTVREIQRATLYDRISELHLKRNQLICTFEPIGVHEAGCDRLQIDLNLEARAWDVVARMMDIVCSDKPFYRRDSL